jgi:hypothetical protein
MPIAYAQYDRFSGRKRTPKRISQRLSEMLEISIPARMIRIKDVNESDYVVTVLLKRPTKIKA